MSLTVRKYRLGLVDDQRIALPEGAEILHVGEQDTPFELVLWALVDPERNNADRYFSIAGTGRPVSLQGGRLIHVSTVQASNGLVWHVFERVSLEM